MFSETMWKILWDAASNRCEEDEAEPPTGGDLCCDCLTFLDLITEQVDLFSSAHTARCPIHPHYLQIGGVWSLWGQKEEQVRAERWLIFSVTLRAFSRIYTGCTKPLPWSFLRKCLPPLLLQLFVLSNHFVRAGIKTASKRGKLNENLKSSA